MYRGVVQVGALPQLEDLYLELHLEDQAGGCYMWYVPGLALPTSLTRLTGFTLQVSWSACCFLGAQCCCRSVQTTTSNTAHLQA
jgi:hypothetical protein